MDVQTAAFIAAFVLVMIIGGYMLRRQYQAGPILPKGTWRAISLGGNRRALREALIEHGVIMTSATSRLIDNMPVSLGKRTVYLVRMRTPQLAGYQYGSFDQIVAGAIRLGFDLCPAEVGPQLRLDYLDQPPVEELYIGMNPLPAPIANEIFLLKHFSVGRNPELLSVPVVSKYGPYDEWVFILRK